MRKSGGTWDRLVRFYLDRVMHLVTPLAILQIITQWASTPERPVFGFLQGEALRRAFIILFSAEIALRVLHVPDWSRLRNLRGDGWGQLWRNRLREGWMVLRTQVLDRWLFFDLIALVSFINLEQLRLLRGLRSVRALARLLRLARVGRVVKQFRPRLRGVGVRLRGGPYTWLIGGNGVCLLGSALVIAALEQCPFGKALSWTAQVFYAGGSYWTELTDARAQAFGDVIKIFGVGFYGLAIGLVPDMVQRARRALRSVFGIRGHMVIVGWSKGAHSLVEHILSVRPQAQRQIYVVGDGDAPGEVKDLDLQYLQGPLADPTTARRASMSAAGAVIVPPGRRELSETDHLDGLSLFLASHLASTDSQEDASRLIACTASAETHDLLKRMGAGVIQTSQTGGRMLSQALLKPGLELVLEEMLSPMGTSVFIGEAPRRWQRHTFSELADASVPGPITPLGLVAGGAVALVPDPALRGRPLAQSEGIVYLAHAPLRFRFCLKKVFCADIPGSGPCKRRGRSQEDSHATARTDG